MARPRNGYGLMKRRQTACFFSPGLFIAVDRPHPADEVCSIGDQRLADRIDTASPQWAACPAFARRAAEPSHPSSKFEHPFCLPSLSPKTPFAFVPPERLPQGAERGLGADSPQQTVPFHPLKSSKCLFLGFDQHSVRTAQIRAQEKSRSGRRVPIIAVTEGTRTESCQACLDFRMDDDITHSLHPGQLGLLLARVARGRED